MSRGSYHPTLPRVNQRRANARPLAPQQEQGNYAHEKNLLFLAREWYCPKCPWRRPNAYIVIHECTVLEVLLTCVRQQLVVLLSLFHRTIAAVLAVSVA